MNCSLELSEKKLICNKELKNLRLKDNNEENEQVLIIFYLNKNQK